jgi:hypothetical protein
MPGVVADRRRGGPQQACRAADRPGNQLLMASPRRELISVHLKAWHPASRPVEEPR